MSAINGNLFRGWNEESFVKNLKLNRNFIYRKFFAQQSTPAHAHSIEIELEVWNIVENHGCDAVDANAEGQNNSMRLIIKFQVDYFTWFMVNCLIGKLKIYTCYWHSPHTIAFECG